MSICLHCISAVLVLDSTTGAPIGHNLHNLRAYFVPLLFHVGYLLRTSEVVELLNNNEGGERY